MLKPDGLLVVVGDKLSRRLVLHVTSCKNSKKREFICFLFAFASNFRLIRTGIKQVEDIGCFANSGYGPTQPVWWRHYKGIS